MMKINGEGFLSIKGQEEARGIINKNAGVLTSFESTIASFRAFTSSVEINTQASDEEKQKVISIVVAARLLEISEASLLIMKNGMSNEANTLFRVFLDAYFVFANVCSDTAFIANYFDSDSAARLKFMNSVTKHDSKLFNNVNQYSSDEVKSELKKKIANEKIKEFNSYAYAEKVGCTEIYDSMYRITSSILHTTPRSLDKYVVEDEEGTVIGIKDRPIEGDIPMRCYDFAFYLIKAISGMKELFGCLKSEEIDLMVKNLNESCEI